MKSLGAIVFIFISFSVLKSMILFEVTGDTPQLPAFPDLDFSELESFEPVSGNSEGVFSAIASNIKAAFINLGRITIDATTTGFSLVAYGFQLLAFLFTVSFDTIDGAPGYINAIILTPTVFMLMVLSYKLVSGASSES